MPTQTPQFEEGLAPHAAGAPLLDLACFWIKCSNQLLFQISLKKNICYCFLSIFLLVKRGPVLESDIATVEDLIQKHARSRSGAPAAGVGSQALLEPGGLVGMSWLTHNFLENFGEKMLQFQEIFFPFSLNVFRSGFEWNQSKTYFFVEKSLPETWNFVLRQKFK